MYDLKRANEIDIENYIKCSKDVIKKTIEKEPQSGEWYLNNNVKEYLDKFPDEVKDLYHQLRNIIYDSASQEVEEKLWAKLPSYYVGDNFVRLIPFKDHINIEAHAIVLHKEELNGYKFTSKGMLQIYIIQSVPVDVLKRVVTDTLCDEVNHDRED